MNLQAKNLEISISLRKDNSTILRKSLIINFWKKVLRRSHANNLVADVGERKKG